MNRQTRRRAALLVGAFAVVALATLVRTVGTNADGTSLPVLLGLGHPIVVTVLVIGYVARYRDHREAETLFETAGLGAACLSLLFAFAGASLIWGQRTQGVEVVTPELAVLNTALGGGLFGVVLGHLYGQTVVQRHELEAREQRLSVMTRILRHNLRNELNVAHGYVGVAADRATDPVADTLAKATSALDNLIATAERTIDAQRTLDSAPVTVDLVDQTEQAVATVRAAHPDRTIELDAAPSGFEVSALPEITAALEELIENACEHGADPVEVRVSTDAGLGTVEITDRGSGVPRWELEAIEDGEESSLQHGSGLGLWIAHWVVEGSGGALSFESNGETTVCVMLPRVDG